MSAKPNEPNANPFGDLLSGVIKQVGSMKQGQGGPDEWYQSYHYPETPNFDPNKLINCARSALYSKAIRDGVVYESRKECARWGFALAESPAPSLVRENLDELVEGFDGRLVYQFKTESTNVKIFSELWRNRLFYVFNDGAVDANCTDGGVILTMVTLSEKKLNLFNKHYRSCIEQVETDTD